MDGKPIYLGVDVAGKDNTWAAAVSAGDGGPEVVFGPQKVKLQELVDYCETENVVAVTIDAQLTIAISEENGFRNSDLELREMLVKRDGVREWVVSVNSLMGVPIRGQMLADRLSPTVGTLLETHPRASLLFALGKKACESVWKYKGKAKKEVRAHHTERLWEMWSDHFGITYSEPVQDDGELDSLVCATVGYLYHDDPDRLHRLRHDVPEKTGRGPFYIVNPG